MAGGQRQRAAVMFITREIPAGVSRLILTEISLGCTKNKLAVKFVL